MKRMAAAPAWHVMVYMRKTQTKKNESATSRRKAKSRGTKADEKRKRPRESKPLAVPATCKHTHSYTSAPLQRRYPTALARMRKVATTSAVDVVLQR